MKQILIALGCYGLMVPSAMAAERWPAETCKHLQEMKAFIKAQPVDEYYKAVQVWPVLIHERTKCTSSVQAEVLATAKVLEAGDPAAKGKSVSAPSPSRQPLNCVTVPLSGGMTATNCN